MNFKKRWSLSFWITAGFFAIFFFTFPLFFASGFDSDPGCAQMTSVVPFAVHPACQHEQEMCSCKTTGEWPDVWHEVGEIEDVQMKIMGEVEYTENKQEARRDVLAFRKSDETSVKRGDATSVEDAAVGEAGYLRWHSEMEGAFVAFDAAVPWGFANDPEKKGTLEHKALLVFHQGFCRVRLDGWADMVTDPKAEFQDGVLRFNEYHWADARKALIYNDHLGFDHGAAAFKEKLLQVAREIDTYLKQNKTCEGFFTASPKILEVHVVGTPKDYDASRATTLRLKFQNIGRRDGHFDAQIDGCGDAATAGYFTDTYTNRVASVNPGETKTNDLVVYFSEQAPRNMTCTLSLKYSFISWSLDNKRIEFEDKREIKLKRELPKDEPEPVVEPLPSQAPPPQVSSKGPTGHKPPLSLGLVPLGAWILKKFWPIFVIGGIGAFGYWIYRFKAK
ncbi:MAG: hypothetical protein HY582_03485 [Candidatus Omnitrophica bacterium]|nr:hypothetical protein [Candidatus Omnitrophota bacterium]